MEFLKKIKVFLRHSLLLTIAGWTGDTIIYIAKWRF